MPRGLLGEQKLRMLYKRTILSHSCCENRCTVSYLGTRNADWLPDCRYCLRSASGCKLKPLISHTLTKNQFICIQFLNFSTKCRAMAVTTSLLLWVTLAGHERLFEILYKSFYQFHCLLHAKPHVLQKRLRCRALPFPHKRVIVGNPAKVTQDERSDGSRSCTV